MTNKVRFKIMKWHSCMKEFRVLLLNLSVFMKLQSHLTIHKQKKPLETIQT